MGKYINAFLNIINSIVPLGRKKHLQHISELKTYTHKVYEKSKKNDEEILAILDAIVCETKSLQPNLDDLLYRQQVIMQEQQSNNVEYIVQLFKQQKDDFNNEVAIVRENQKALQESIGQLQYNQKESQKSMLQMQLLIQEMKEKQEENVEKIGFIRRQVIASRRAADEGVWGEIFNNTITHSDWLKDKTFSPGRWALGYPALYSVYRILNEVKPVKILECGLGQSTRLIGQYTMANPDTEHYVVEHDQKWIDLFKSGFELSDRTKIIHSEWEFIPYKEVEDIRVFKGFKSTFTGIKFDFICIDAPYGADMKGFARIDILGILPHCLEESFIILIDDVERCGERNTVGEIEKILEEHQIHYVRGYYSGKKDSIIISSIDNKFVCSM